MKPSEVIAQLEEPGERCQNCGQFYLTVYEVPDRVWLKIGPKRGGAGLLCLSCADNLARDMGVYLAWKAHIVGEDRKQALRQEAE